MKILLSLFFIFSFVLAGTAFAQETETNVETTAEIEAEAEAEVTNEDLGVEEPGLLPTSPFYFFKEIGRGLQRALTFDSIAKTELEMKIASEKAAEAKKVAEEDPNNERGIARALANYERAQERLRARLEGLRDTSENPNIDRLLDAIAQRQLVHTRLLQNLEDRHDAQRDTIQNIRTRIHATFEEIANKDLPDRFQERLENAFGNSASGTLRHIRSLNLTDRLLERGNVSDQAKQRLQELRTRLQDRVQERMQDRRGNSSAPTSTEERNGDVACTMEYAPVCGVDGNTYGNRCVAEQQNRVRVAYEGECRADTDNNSSNIQGQGPNILRPDTPISNQNNQAPTLVTPVAETFMVDADDSSFSPAEIRVKKGAIVTIMFHVSPTNVYYGGLDFRSPKFETEQILPGDSTAVQFTADESFEFKSYWPASGVLKATGRVIVE